MAKMVCSSMQIASNQGAFDDDDDVDEADEGDTIDEVDEGVAAVAAATTDAPLGSISR
jgi:hypothetical protein